MSTKQRPEESTPHIDGEPVEGAPPHTDGESVEGEDILEAEVLDAYEDSEADDDALPAAALGERVDASERLPAPSDALSQYMAALSAHEPISREEEHALAVRWVEEGDRDAARKLVLSNLRLVVKIAMEYRRSWTQVLDLIQEGNLGLVQAVQRFDPYQGTKLSSYAVYWIRAFILKHLIDNIRMVRMGSSRAERKLFFRLNKEKRQLEREGFKVEPKLLAERLDVTEDDVVSMEQRLSEGEVSFDAPVSARGDGDGAVVGDFVASNATGAEERVADEQLRETFMKHVREFAEELEPRERAIVDRRVLADEPATLQELGTEFGVSRERVRQLERRVVDSLREYLRENVVDFEYYAEEE